MKLTKIYFDAFKSLLNKELEINHDCIGFVGTNESGKSNVLTAINILSGSRKLTASDTPKMSKTNNPSLRFLFTLKESEIKEFKNLFSTWRKNNTIIPTIEFPTTFFYNIIFDKTKGEEQRFFSVDGFKIENDILILLQDKLNEPYKIQHNGTFIPLNKAVLLKQADINADKTITNSNEIDKINKQITFEENVIKKHTEKLSALQSNADIIANENGTPITASTSQEVINAAISVDLNIGTKETLKIEIEKSNKKIETLNQKKTEFESKVKDFNILSMVKEFTDNINSYELEIVKLESEIQTSTSRIPELEQNPTLDETQKSELENLKQSVIDANNKIRNLQELKTTFQQTITSLNEPLNKKYTKDINELNKYYNSIIQAPLNNLLPKVVFWEHSTNYILKSETLFSELLEKSSLNDISRPLVNVFRIGLGIKDFDELKAKINEIQNDSNERSRIEKTLNKKINDFILSVWEDYDQKINITLEKEQIRIEIFDPEHEEASYYNMEERSQGCKTFLSFLMTIGAEAEHGVIANTILLLDEPETHLHPSGVRFMLQELIKISESDNLVIYATHSIFLIDRKNYNRHIILEKEKEHTIIKPSSSGRIGYFMQEEVLYNTLDLDLNTDFTSTKKYNFVFEGDGDAVIFGEFYDAILKVATRPFPIDSTSFYQGGKCSDIQKYFNTRPIQLGTKWVFVLDKDSPADGLKKFIEGRYKDYLDKDIFVYQYSNEKKGEKEIEFEDLLPAQFIIETYQAVCKQLNITIQERELKKLITEETPYTNYEKEIIQKVDEDKQEQFKIKFKETLNLKIKSSFESLVDEEKFKIAFPEYYKWVTEIIAKLPKLKK